MPPILRSGVSRLNNTYVPSGTNEQSALFLFLPGMDSDPASTAHLPVIAAYAGHKTLSLAWDNQESVAFR